jgi:ech hydrogenase subunit D
VPEIEYRTIKPVELMNVASDLKAEGCRLIQICASKSGDYIELDYSFDKDYQFIDLKMPLSRDDEVNSISSIFPPAFLYENEINALFGVEIHHMTVDFKGNLYMTAKKTPFKVEEKDGEA